MGRNKEDAVYPDVSVFFIGCSVQSLQNAASGWICAEYRVSLVFSLFSAEMLNVKGEHAPDVGAHVRPVFGIVFPLPIDGIVLPPDREIRVRGVEESIRAGDARKGLMKVTVYPNVR